MTRPETATGEQRLRVILLVLGAGTLIVGILGGLHRMGMAVPALGAATLAHGSLIISGFFGTVISLERAIAFRGRLALVVPAVCTAATVAMLVGMTAVAGVLALLAPVLLTSLSLAILVRQRALHTLLLAAAPLAWLAGNALYLAGFSLDAATSWWFCFLVLTIAAERLELTRLAPRHPIAAPLLGIAVLGVITGAGSLVVGSRVAYALFGCSLVATAAWLALFDVARRTVRLEGLARFAAVALLGGYWWLAVAGLAWAVLPTVPQSRDAAIHALALGFVISMIFAHAPIILPIVTRTRVAFTAAFYAPLVLLHVSLVMRVVMGLSLFGWRQAGAVLNALAIALFAMVLVYARTGSHRRSNADDAKKRNTIVT